MTIKNIIIPAMLLLTAVESTAQKEFSDYFCDSTLYVAFSSKTENQKFKFLEIYSYAYQPTWNGTAKLPAKSPTDSDRRIAMLSGEGDTIYNFAYSSLMDEWLTVCDTRNDYDNKVYNEIHTLPYPKNEVSLVLQQRDSNGKYRTYHSENFEPHSPMREMPPKDFLDQKPQEEIPLLTGGPNKSKVDLVILPQAYDSTSMHRFNSVARLFVDRLLEYEPFKSNKDKFNIRMLKIYSRNTNKNSLDFQSGVFGMDRYIGAWSFTYTYLRAMKLPCDGLIVFTNSDEYGGGGIYNHYAVFTGNHPLSVEGMIHEFGHSFANLEDEYEGDVFQSKEQPNSHCIMRTLSEHQFCEKCQQKILQSIKYWTGE